MSSVSLNSPRPSFLHADQSLHFISPNYQDSASLSCPTFFNIIDQRKTIHDREDDNLVLHGGSRNHQVCNTTSLISAQPFMDDPSDVCGHNSPLYKMAEDESKRTYGSSRWVSSKVRLMRKMMTPNHIAATDDTVANNVSQTVQNQHHDNGKRGPSTRVCADCNTTNTPLWRGGPKGPKSLCNACGIRQRKARRAMAEAAAAAAANGSVSCTDACSATKTRIVHNKEKKARTNHLAEFKNKCKASAAAGTCEGEKRLGSEDFALSLRSNSAIRQVFPRDEVAEAALLLMDLSCGFVHF